MQSTNAPQSAKTLGWIRDYLNSYGINISGNTYFVDSGHANTADTNNGSDKDFPRETIESCFTADTVLVTANNGDLIVVQPGHNEEVDAAADLDLDIAGVTIAFMGEGESQAKITFGTTSTADMDIDAANITLVRPKFVADVDALAGPIDVNATDFTIIDGRYLDGATKDTTDAVVAGSSATRLRIHGMKYYRGNEGGSTKESFIQLDGVDDAEIFNVRVMGAFDTGIIENTGDEVLNIHFKDLVLQNTDASPKPGMIIDGSATGIAERVLIRVASGTTYVDDPGLINWYESYGTGTDAYQIDDAIGTETSSAVGLIGAIEDASTDSVHGKIGTDTEMGDVSLFDMLGSGLQTNDLVSLIGRTPTSDTTESLHGKIGTDTEMSDTSLFDMLGSGLQTNDLVTLIGRTPTSDTTESLHGKIGTDTEMSDTSIFDMLGSGLQTNDLASLIGRTPTSTTTDSLHGKIGTDTEMSDTSLFDMLGSGLQTNDLVTLIGRTPTSGTTESLHGKLGSDADYADTSLFTMLGSGLQTNDLVSLIGRTPTSDTTESLHGKIGTDTEMGDVSLFDMLGTGAKTTSISAALGAIVSKNIDLSSGHELTDSPVAEFTVTGDVLVRAVGAVSTTCLSNGNDGTIELGVSDNTAIIIPQATVDNTSLQAGDAWFDATSGKVGGPMPDDGAYVVIAGGADINMVIATSSMTAGNVNVYVQWIPLSDGATVVAA